MGTSLWYLIGGRRLIPKADSFARSKMPVGGYVHPSDHSRDPFQEVVGRRFDANILVAVRSTLEKVVFAGNSLPLGQEIGYRMPCGMNLLNIRCSPPLVCLQGVMRMSRSLNRTMSHRKRRHGFTWNLRDALTTLRSYLASIEAGRTCKNGTALVFFGGKK